MFPQPPRRVQRPGTSPSRAPASRSAALCGASVLRVPVSVLCARFARCCVSVTSLPLAARLLIHFSLPRLRSLPPSMLSGYFPASRAPPGSPGSSSLTSVPLLLGSLLLECTLPCLRVRSLRAQRCIHPLLPVCLISRWNCVFITVLCRTRTREGLSEAPPTPASCSILTATEFYTQGLDPIGPVPYPLQYYFLVPSHRCAATSVESFHIHTKWRYLLGWPFILLPASNF